MGTWLGGGLRWLKSGVGSSVPGSGVNVVGSLDGLGAAGGKIMGAGVEFPSVGF